MYYDSEDQSTDQKTVHAQQHREYYVDRQIDVNSSRVHLAPAGIKVRPETAGPGRRLYGWLGSVSRDQQQQVRYD